MRQLIILQVVYLSETAGYIPVTSLRNRPTGINAGYHIDGDIDAWRHESWDRDYNHRNRFNNTRVQRKLLISSDAIHIKINSINANNQDSTSDDLFYYDDCYRY